MKPAAVVVAWNGEKLLPDCISALLGQDTRPRIVVVDNASTDDSCKILNRLRKGHAKKNFALINNQRNVGFTGGANIGMQHLLDQRDPPDVILLVNQDLVLDSAVTKILIEIFETEPEAAVVGCKILYPGGKTIQHAGGLIEGPRWVALHHGHHHKAGSRKYNQRREVDFVTGAAMALRVEALRQAGLFDEIFSPGYFEDVELCQRLHEHGWKVLYTPEAVAHHAESSSFTNWHERWVLSHRNRLIFALPKLIDKKSRTLFVAAETEHIEAIENIDEVHALAQAYFRLLLDLSAVVRVRVEQPLRTPEVLEALTAVFKDLRNRCVAAVHNQLATRIPGT